MVHTYCTFWQSDDWHCRLCCVVKCKPAQKKWGDGQLTTYWQDRCVMKRIIEWFMCQISWTLQLVHMLGQWINFHVHHGQFSSKACLFGCSVDFLCTPDLCLPWFILLCKFSFFLPSCLVFIFICDAFTWSVICCLVLHVRLLFCTLSRFFPAFWTLPRTLYLFSYMFY